ncbi:hypothetical protein, partial [Alkalibacterium psychrotolerans]
VCFSELHFIRLRGEEVPFCTFIDRATLVALKHVKNIKKLVTTYKKWEGIKWILKEPFKN